MRYTAKRPCRMPGCPALVARGFCDAHRPAPRPERSASRRGYGGRWRKYTRWFRQQPENVICKMCEHAPTQCVDHIVPVSGADDPLFWEPGNHQGLCNSCHSTKTVVYDGGFGRKGVGGLKFLGDKGLQPHHLGARASAGFGRGVPPE